MGDKWKDEKGFSLFVFSLSSGLPKENLPLKISLRNLCIKQILHNNIQIVSVNFKIKYINEDICVFVILNIS